MLGCEFLSRRTGDKSRLNLAKHIHLLRRSSETFLLAQVFPRYFPSIGDLRKLESTDRCPLWLCGISQTEISSYEVTRERVMEFLEDAEAWEEEYLSNVSCVNHL